MAAARCLLEAGHDPVVFEAGSEVGGIWAPEPTNPVVYPGLVTNIPTACMQSFDLDFQEALPSYVTAADLGRYVVDYSEHFALRSCVRFNACVTSVQLLPGAGNTANEPAADPVPVLGPEDPVEDVPEAAEDAEGWRLNWTAGEDEVAEDFEALVVASGHYTSPFTPELPGQRDWQAGATSSSARTLSHSVTYKGPEPYSGRAVLVVGGRSSAVDVARELRDAAKWVYVLSKDCAGEPEEVGSCTHVPLGTELTAEGHLKLGDELVSGPPVDDVILATGYEYVFPFLPDLDLDFGPCRRYVAPLYQHIVHARFPSLFFLGIPLAVPCPIPFFEAQARFMAAYLSGAVSPDAATTRSQREAWVLGRFNAVGERTQDLHFLGGLAWGYMQDLTRLADVGGPEYDAYCQRLDVVRRIHEDRGLRRPQNPWGDDDYRFCEYDVDWATCTWTVTEGRRHSADAVARPS